MGTESPPTRHPCWLQLRSDPDLTALRADERFEGFLRRYERKQPEKTGFMGLF